MTGARALRSLLGMMLRLYIALTAGLGLASCGDGGNNESTGSTGSTGDTGDTETGEPPTQIGFDEFYGAAEEAFCTWQVGCRQYGVEARCRSVNHMEARLSMQRLAGVGASGSVPLEYMKEAVEVGRIVYDKKAAATCLEYVRARTCEIEYLHTWSEEELVGQAACEAVFAGRMGRNGPCGSAAECAEESVCGFDPSCMDMCCVGACRVLAQPLGLGDACGGNTSCAADLFCDFDPVTSNPTVCKASPTVNQPCPNGSCASGSFCEYDGETQTCRAPKAEGQLCDSGSECVQPAVCQYNDDVFTGRCYRPRDEGEACDPSVYDAQCLRVDNTCHPVDKVCVALPANGEACPDYRCAGDFFCSQDQGMRCLPVADAGEPCGYDNVPCSGDHYCDYDSENSKCKVPSGEAGCPVPADPGQGT